MSFIFLVIGIIFGVLVERFLLSASKPVERNVEEVVLKRTKPTIKISQRIDNETKIQAERMNEALQGLYNDMGKDISNLKEKIIIKTQNGNEETQKSIPEEDKETTGLFF